MERKEMKSDGVKRKNKDCEASSETAPYTVD